ncbi:MAG: methyltransferase domain-containing protein [Desulfohalobiaceae bacterium]
MRALDRDSFATLEFNLQWQSRYAEHQERFLARKVNIWRDMFPPGLEEALMGKKPGDRLSLNYEPGVMVPAHRLSQEPQLPRHSFRPPRDLNPMQPRFGRFYPQGFLQNLVGIYPQNTYPFRVLGLDGVQLTADLNHPLAQYPLSLELLVHNTAAKDSDVGGRCSVWAEEICNQGPGLQARFQGQPTDFELAEPLMREDENPDQNFYSRPRFIGHVDQQASEHLQQEYSRYLMPGMRVLDLMSSLQSHLPLDMDLEVTGLGLNLEELQANPRLSKHLIQDINQQPELPFASGSFEALICSLSIEYVTRPLSLLREMYRVLAPGGTLLISFSNRWFPPKVTRLWTSLHEFERLGLVLELALRTDGLKNLQTTTIRNWWRPKDDKWYGWLFSSDPVYLLVAKKED